MSAQQPLSGPRSPRWRVWLLNERDERIREITDYSGGQVNLSATDRLGGDASLVLGDVTGIDWQKNRCQIVYDPGVEDVAPWPVGTYLFSSPVYQHGVVDQWRVGLQTKLLILDEATTAGPLVVEKDQNLVQAVVDLIEQETGETRIAATPSDLAASSDIVFPTGETILKTVNTLLEAANYWAIRVDGSGQYIIAPYQVPGERPIAWRFASGETALHHAEWTREQDQTSVPNRVECFTPGTPEEDPLIGVATNTDPDSPYSFQARGRWVVRREQVEAAGQAEIDALAERFLLGGMSPVGKLSVTHAMLPLTPRQVVHFQSGDYQVRAAIQKMGFPMDFDAEVKAEWNEVRDA